MKCDKEFQQQPTPCLAVPQFHVQMHFLCSIVHSCDLHANLFHEIDFDNIDLQTASNVNLINVYLETCYGYLQLGVADAYLACTSSFAGLGLFYQW